MDCYLLHDVPDFGNLPARRCAGVDGIKREDCAAYSHTGRCCLLGIIQSGQEHCIGGELAIQAEKIPVPILAWAVFVVVVASIRVTVLNALVDALTPVAAVQVRFSVMAAPLISVPVSFRAHVVDAFIVAMMLRGTSGLVMPVVLTNGVVLLNILTTAAMIWSSSLVSATGMVWIDIQPSRLAVPVSVLMGVFTSLFRGALAPIAAPVIRSSPKKSAEESHSTTSGSGHQDGEGIPSSSSALHSIHRVGDLPAKPHDAPERYHVLLE